MYSINASLKIVTKSLYGTAPSFSIFHVLYLSMTQVVEDGAEILGIPVNEKGTALVLKTKRATT
jgi:hypothetical protein